MAVEAKQEMQTSYDSTEETCKEWYYLKIGFCINHISQLCIFSGEHELLQLKPHA